MLKKTTGRLGSACLLSHKPMTEKSNAADYTRDRYSPVLVSILILSPCSTKRGTEKEINYILEIGERLEEKLYSNEDRQNEEKEFHKAIAKATHNEYINKIMPILIKDMDKAVTVTSSFEELRTETIRDHRLIMDFMKRRDAEGAKAAMRLHMVHALSLMTERVEKK